MEFELRTRSPTRAEQHPQSVYSFTTFFFSFMTHFMTQKFRTAVVVRTGTSSAVVVRTGTTSTTVVVVRTGTTY